MSKGRNAEALPGLIDIDCGFANSGDKTPGLMVASGIEHLQASHLRSLLSCMEQRISKSRAANKGPAGLSVPCRARRLVRNPNYGYGATSEAPR